MSKDDRAKRIAEEINSNPLLAAAVYGLGAAVLGAGWAAANSTPEKDSNSRKSRRATSRSGPHAGVSRSDRRSATGCRKAISRRVPARTCSSSAPI
jgi:hypothetical protein